MRLVGLRKQLTSESLTQSERQKLLVEIKKLEEEMKMN